MEKDGHKRMADRNGEVFCRYGGKDISYSIPSISYIPGEKNGVPVTGIAAKAFLSCKTLQKLEIPDGVAWIGDWAFAHMQNLEELTLPFSEIAYGKKVFLDCVRLKKITVRGSTAKNEGLPYFLASAATLMDAAAEKNALWKPEYAADERTHGEWMEQYDRALAEYLKAPDEEGFEPVFIGWFHVEDMDEQIPKYMVKRRKEKIRLVLQRLRYPAYLQTGMEAYLHGYLKAGMRAERNDGLPAGRAEGSSLVTETICDRKQEYCRQVCYLKILKESGCLNGESIRLLMEGLQETNPEMTAYLLECMEEERAGEDFFNGLEL